jgi:hypothetical protein
VFSRSQAERALLNHKSRICPVTRTKQDLAGRNMSAFRPDRQNAQRGPAEHRQRRHLL